MNVERLQILADFLKEVPDNEFIMRRWAEAKIGDINEIASHIHEPGKSKCGFAACALGWACQIPALRNVGLGLYGFVPRFESKIGYEAAGRLFDISTQQSEYLFWRGSYQNTDECDDVKPKTVSERIESLILKEKNSENYRPSDG